MHRIGYVLPEGFQIMALATQAVFEFTNHVMRERVYEVENYAFGADSVRSSMGAIVATRPLTMRSRADTWMVAGTVEPALMQTDQALRPLLTKLASQASRVAGLCTGAFVLAEAGLLDGRRATTHWIHADEMQRKYPAIQVDSDRIYINDGNFWTSAGMTAEIDLALGLVEKDFGSELARSVAHRLVMPQRRTGGQSQHSEMLKLAPKSDRIQKVLHYARSHLSQPLSVDDLADVVHLSPRQFSRLFTAETGQSPAKAIEGLRLEAARLMIEESRHSLEVVARETGFRDRQHLREVFHRGFGIAPRSVRRPV